MIDARLGQLAINSVLLAMIGGAALIRFNGVIAARLVNTSNGEGCAEAELPETPEKMVVIGGYGRVGHTVAVLLHSKGIPFLAFDADPKQVAKGRADGFPVFYGDITDPGLLSAIHVERAALVVVTVDKSDTALNAVSSLRKTCPQVPVIARARDLASSSRLLAAGAIDAYPETIEASLRLGATALRLLQVAEDDIDAMLQDVRNWDYKPVLGEDQET